jgi:hypothetical protein
MHKKNNIFLVFATLFFGMSISGAEEFVCEGGAPKFPQRTTIFIDCDDSALVGQSLTLALQEAERTLGSSAEERASIEMCKISADSISVLDSVTGSQREQVLKSFLGTCNRALSMNTRIPTGVSVPQSQRTFQDIVKEMPIVPTELVNSRGAEPFEKAANEFRQYWQIDRRGKPSKAGMSSIEGWVCVIATSRSSNNETESFYCDAVGIVRSSITVRLNGSYKGRLYKGDVVAVSGVISELRVDHGNYTMNIEKSTFKLLRINDWLAMAKQHGYRPDRSATNMVDVSVVENLPDNVTELEQLANRGDIKAQYKLGTIFLLKPIEDNLAPEAFKWFLAAANNGFAKAQYQVGLMYIEGFGVEADFSRASRWLRQAADRGIPDATTQLDALLQFGAQKALAE